MQKSKSKSFEADLKRLEEIVKKLEDGSVPLEDSIKLFQEGTALAASCGALLDQAELEIVKLTKGPDGSLREVPFANEESV
jgi:exodeoxyribonuclease VII small subunit